MKRKNIVAAAAAFLMAILIAPITVNAAGIDHDRMDGYKEMNEAIDRMWDLNPYNLGIFRNDAEAKEYQRLYERVEVLMAEYCGGKYDVVETELGTLVMTKEESAQYGKLTGRDKLSFAADVAVLNGTIERNPLKDDAEEPEEPEKKIISASDVFQFAGNTLREVYEKANAAAPNGSTVDLEDVKNFVIDRIAYGGCDNWKETTWIAYIESWKPVYTLEDGTKTDFDGALKNAERIEEEKRQETGLPYPDLPVIPGFNEPENKDDIPADAVDKDENAGEEDKDQNAADKKPVKPAEPVAPVEPVAPEAPAQPEAPTEPSNGGNDAANDQAAAKGSSPSNPLTYEDVQKRNEEDAAKNAAAEEAARNGQEGVYDAGNGVTVTVDENGAADVTWEDKTGQTEYQEAGSITWF